MGVTTGVLILALVAPVAQDGPVQPDVLVLLEAPGDERLMEEIRSRPDAVRGAFRELFASATRATHGESRVHHLLQAGRLAGATSGVASLWPVEDAATAGLIGPVRRRSGRRAHQAPCPGPGSARLPSRRFTIQSPSTGRPSG